MSLSATIERTVGTQGIPVWINNELLNILPGGFLLTNPSLPTGTVIPAGQPMVYDESARTAGIMATGVAYASATNVATTYQLKKGHLFKVGDYLATGAEGNKAYAITAIDTSNAAYDTLTVGTTLGVVVSAGDLFWASTATGASASAMPAINGLLYDDVISGAQVGVTVVVAGTVYARRVAYNSTIASKLSRFIYSQSK